MKYSCRCGFAARNWPAMHQHSQACDPDRFKLDLETFMRTLAFWGEPRSTDADPLNKGIPESWKTVEARIVGGRARIRFRMEAEGNPAKTALVTMTLPAASLFRWITIDIAGHGGNL